MTSADEGDAGVLHVRVTKDLTLDAGVWHLTDDPQYGHIATIVPPDTPMFLQLIGYLDSQPAPPWGGMRAADEARAATAVCVRWGSYFAVITDPARPFAPEVGDHRVSHIDDDEMARMNIEISAAIQWWLELAGSDHGRYWELVHRALAYIPVGPKTVKPLPVGNQLLACASGTLAAELRKAWPRERLEEDLATAANHGVRVMANSITLQAWRNGPIEKVHAGMSDGYGLLERRVLVHDEKAVIRQVRGSLYGALRGLDLLRYDGAWPPPAERVLPFMRVFFFPRRWSYTEQSRVVRLPLRKQCV